MPAISREWEEYAATLVPERQMSRSVLRNGIVQMLELLAMEVDRPRGEPQHKEKHILGASRQHAEDRTRMGIDTPQLLSEFCALRSTIIRMWQDSGDVEERNEIDVMLRFNEAVDQMQLEAATRYHETTEHHRDLFLAILGHDLRNPLAAIMGAAEVQLSTSDQVHDPAMARQIKVSAKRMSRMISDLLELTRISQGKDLPLELQPNHPRRLCANVLEEMKMAHPEREFRLEGDADPAIDCDEPRMTQVISNLVGNAVAYGDPATPVTICVRTQGEEVTISVHNEGEPIPPELMPAMFDSFVRGQPGRPLDDGTAPGLGLGLYIAKEILVAHGGGIAVSSNKEEGTTFHCRLPRRTV